MKSRPYPMFESMCLAHGLPQPEREVKFHPDRKWRFDFAWFVQRVALEIEGGIFMANGGHRSMTKFLRELEKYNEAALLKWTVLRCTTDDVKDGSVFQLLKRALCAYSDPPTPPDDVG